MNMSRVVAVAAVLALASGCASGEDEGASNSDTGTPRTSQTGDTRERTAVGVLASANENSYSEDQLIYVDAGTPSAVDAVVKCDGPDYTLVSESYMEGDGELMTIVGSAEAQAHIAPGTVAEAVGVGTDAVVSRYEKALTKDSGGGLSVS